MELFYHINFQTTFENVTVIANLLIKYFKELFISFFLIFIL